jgi:hypothetical protein
MTRDNMLDLDSTTHQHISEREDPLIPSKRRVLRDKETKTLHLANMRETSLSLDLSLRALILEGLRGLTRLERKRDLRLDLASTKMGHR